MDTQTPPAVLAAPQAPIFLFAANSCGLHLVEALAVEAVEAGALAVRSKARRGTAEAQSVAVRKLVAQQAETVRSKASLGAKAVGPSSPQRASLAVRQLVASLGAKAVRSSSPPRKAVPQLVAKALGAKATLAAPKLVAALAIRNKAPIDRRAKALGPPPPRDAAAVSRSAGAVSLAAQRFSPTSTP
jgi:hypothetical protein